jgi:nicotinate-nucleotide pyrophosphorylase
MKRALEGIKRQRGQKAIEVKKISEAIKAIRAGAKRLLLDNMNLKTLRKTVKLCRRAGVKTEASGGVNLQNVRAIAKAGVDYISVGALTHSAPALDVSLKIV